MAEQVQATIRSGHIGEYDVILTDAGISVLKDGKVTHRHLVPDYGTPFGELIERPGFRTGWGRTADFEVLGFYDKDDGNFGYAYNLTWDEGEWTYCYFGTGEDEA